MVKKIAEGGFVKTSTLTDQRRFGGLEIVARTAAVAS
jgi:hypothetical protein